MTERQLPARRPLLTRSLGCNPSSPRVSRFEHLEDRRLLSTINRFEPAPPSDFVETSPLEPSYESAAASDRLFALHVDGNIGRIYEVNPDTGDAVRSFPAPESIDVKGYQGLALGPANLFFLDGSGNGPHTLYELDSQTGTVIDSDSVGSSSDPPVSGLACLDGLVYLGRPSNRSLLVWDPVADQRIETLDVDFAIGGGLTGAADLGLLFDSNGSGDVASIDPEDGRVVENFHTNYTLSGGLAYVDGELLAGDYGTGRIYRIDPITGLVFGSFLSPGSGKLTGLAGDGATPAPTEVRGTVWSDLNGNRLYDDGEPGLENWTVFLDDDQDGLVDPEEASAVTDANGSYAIIDVPPGTHFLSEALPSAWAQTFPGPTPSQGRLFALWTHDETAVGTIVEVNPSDGSIINEFFVPDTAPRPGFQGLAVGPDRLYYVEGDSFHLYELGLDTGAVIATHVLTPSHEESISGLAYLDGMLYLVQHDEDRILAWNPLTEALVDACTFTAVDLGGSLTGSGDEGLLFCGNGLGEIFAIDPGTGTVERSFSTGLGQLKGGMAYVGDELIVSAFGSPATAYRVDPVSGNLLGTLDLGGSQFGFLTGLGGDGAVGESPCGSHIVNVTQGLVVDNVNFGNTPISSSASLFGSAGDDVIVFTTSDTEHVVTINGDIHVFDPATVTEIHIDGLDGTDRITIYGTDGKEVATLRPDSVDVLGIGYKIYAVGVETIVVDGAAGTDDEATLIGSGGSNRLYSYADYSTLTDSPRTYSHRVEGFETLNVDAPAGVRNYAFLYDSPQNDELDANPDRVILKRAVGTPDATVTTATGFERAYGYATQGGTDTADLTGSAATLNRFYGYADYSLLTESRRSFYFYARGFGTVTAVSPGDDYTYAYLHDSTGLDTFEATPEYAVLSRPDPWSVTRAEGFKRVYAYSTHGGDDTAALTGNPDGRNNLRAYPTYSTLTDQSRSFYHYARGFRSLTAEGSATDPSNDRAYLYDSSGADTFYDDGQYAYLEDKAGMLYQNRVRYFDLVYARSSDRDTDDSIDIEPDQELVYLLIRSGTW